MPTKPSEEPSEDSDGATCGIVMPISALDNCSETHWSEVLAIVSDAISDANLRPNLVSNADDVGIIQKRIIQNLYENPIVVCDVSGKNPNVMFELGLRLAFDKPTIIIKDDKTDYSFDTSPIEHLSYPRDLRFSQIVQFKRELKNKIQATLQKSRTDQNYTTFLKHFGDFTVVEISKKEVTQQEYLSEELAEIRRHLRSIDMRSRRNDPRRASRPGICLEGMSDMEVDEIRSIVNSHPDVRNSSMERMGDHFHIYPVYKSGPEERPDQARAEIMNAVSDLRATYRSKKN